MVFLTIIIRIINGEGKASGNYLNVVIHKKKYNNNNNNKQMLKYKVVE
jgi:hypothetical protein